MKRLLVLLPLLLAGCAAAPVPVASRAPLAPAWEAANAKARGHRAGHAPEPGARAEASRR